MCFILFPLWPRQRHRFTRYQRNSIQLSAPQPPFHFHIVTVYAVHKKCRPARYNDVSLRVVPLSPAICDTRICKYERKREIPLVQLALTTLAGDKNFIVPLPRFSAIKYQINSSFPRISRDHEVWRSRFHAVRLYIYISVSPNATISSA